MPTAFCGYSFHVIEALIVFTNEVLVCYLLPIHAGLHRCYHLYTTVIHEGEWVGGWVAGWLGGWVGRWEGGLPQSFTSVGGWEGCQFAHSELS